MARYDDEFPSNDSYHKIDHVAGKTKKPRCFTKRYGGKCWCSCLSKKKYKLPRQMIFDYEKAGSIVESKNGIVRDKTGTAILEFKAVKKLRRINKWRKKKGIKLIKKIESVFL